MNHTQTYIEPVLSGSTYRAQTKSNDGTLWIDGNLYQRLEQAQQNAAELHVQYGNRVRIIGGA